MPISVVLTDGLWDFVSRVDSQPSAAAALWQHLVSEDDSDSEEIDKKLRKFRERVCGEVAEISSTLITPSSSTSRPRLPHFQNLEIGQGI